MVWFQCEDCGENLKKPKLPNHFRICSASKLSCIDCGQMFSQQSVQGHTQCISEAEKYGPKDQIKTPNGAQTKPKPKPGSDVDITVGLSSHAPWFCSLCNTHTTSRQTLLLHADGKKHRAKARAYHAVQKQSSHTEESTQNKNLGDETPMVEPVEANGINLDEMKEKDQLRGTPALTAEEGKQSLMKKRRKHHEATGKGGGNEVSNASDLMNSEVILDGTEVQQLSRPKKKKCSDVDSQNKDHGEENGQAKEASHQKIKWKKLVISILKLNSDGVVKVRKLQKRVVKALQESGLNEDETQLRNKLMDKISTSSQFVLDNKYIRLATKAEN